MFSKNIMPFNTIINNHQFLKTSMVQPKIETPKSLIGTYKLNPFNLAYSVESLYPYGPSPFRSSIIIEKKLGSLLWGKLYYKPEAEPNWATAQFTGVIQADETINLVVDKKSTPTGDPAIYTLTPTQTGYIVNFKVPYSGISFKTQAKKISNKFIIPI